MDPKILISLINNAALLLAMCIVYDALTIKQEIIKPWIRQVLSGTILGAICIAVMLNPLQWYQGIIFDTRSVLLCVAGLFSNPFPHSSSWAWLPLIASTWAAMVSGWEFRSFLHPEALP